MSGVIAQCFTAIIFGMTAAGCIVALGATLVMRRLASASLPSTPSLPSVTILKPLAGAEPQLYDNLASFCAQDYAGPVQILLGVQEPGDPAIDAVNRLIAAWPARNLELVVSGASRGTNRKVANLMGMGERIEHEVVIIADSDIRVGPDYLSKTVAALEQPNVGLVTCLYRGAAEAGIWARLASMAIDYHFLPGAVLGVKLGIARPCFGSTIALRRETLAAIGGFEAFLERLADDYAMGEAVRRRGLKVAIPLFVVAHVCSEHSAGELLRHELRWARTIRAVSPLGYASSIVAHPLPLALLGAWLTGFGALGMGALAAAIACRLVLQLQVDHTLQIGFNRWWLGPARDLLSFAIFVGSFFVGVVSWRGHRYRVRADGTLVPCSASSDDKG